MGLLDRRVKKGKGHEERSAQGMSPSIGCKGVNGVLCLPKKEYVQANLHRLCSGRCSTWKTQNEGRATNVRQERIIDMSSICWTSTFGATRREFCR